MAIELLARSISFVRLLFIIKDFICLSLAVLSIFSFSISTSDLLRLILIFTFRSRCFSSSFFIFCLFHSLVFHILSRIQYIQVIDAFFGISIYTFLFQNVCVCVLALSFCPFYFYFIATISLLLNISSRRKKKSLRLIRNEKKKFLFLTEQQKIEYFFFFTISSSIQTRTQQ